MPGTQNTGDDTAEHVSFLLSGRRRRNRAEELGGALRWETARWSGWGELEKPFQAEKRQIQGSREHGANATWPLMEFNPKGVEQEQQTGHLPEVCSADTAEITTVHSVQTVLKLSGNWGQR